MRSANLRFLLVFALAATLQSSALAKPSSESTVAVLVFTRGTDANLAIRIERDLRRMYNYDRQTQASTPKAVSIEPRFDVGHISKRHLSLSSSQFNSAQRSLARNEPEEALEFLTKARRFYLRAIPYSSNSDLLRGIFYYDYLATKAVGDSKSTVGKYCAYVALVRALAGSVGPLDQFEPLADQCGQSEQAGTVELKIKANVDGAHVFIDNRAVGVVGRAVPYVNPFIPAGPHFVEVRKAGYVRWGTLALLKSGQPRSLRARLKTARADVRQAEYEPLNKLILSGPDAHSEEYLTEILFRVSELYGVNSLVLGYLETAGRQKLSLSLLHFTGGSIERSRYKIPKSIDGYRPALKMFWKTTFKRDLSPADALPDANKFAPTFFKVSE
jgi:hypothetical protein